MKRFLLILGLVLLLGGVSASWGLAQRGPEAGYALPRWTVDGGGGSGGGGGYDLAGTIGQPEAAAWQGGGYDLQGGFWAGGQPGGGLYHIYLPLVRR